MNIVKEILEAWKDVEKPNGFIADIESSSQAIFEYEDVEKCFTGLRWDQVDPEAEDIRHMCPLLWMNEDAAKYYSQSFLVYLGSQRAIETPYEVPNMAVSYFTDSEFSILSKLSKLQQTLAQQVIAEYERKNT